MKTDINGCSTTTARGTEHYEPFIARHVSFIQYDYRHTNGNLFSTIATSLEICRQRRDEWIKNQK